MAQRPPDLDERGLPTVTRPPDLPEQSTSSHGINPWVVGSAAAAATAAGLALRNPEAAKKIYDVALAARYPGMLSGFALPKSLEGDIGAVLNTAAKQRSLAPLKELFTRQTAKDFMEGLRAPQLKGSHELADVSRYADNPVAQKIVRWNPFGRLIGAGDYATRRLLQRPSVGLTAEEAAKETLQSPIPREYAKILGGRLGQTAVPMQRTGFNQFFGGLDEAQLHPLLALLSGGAGALSSELSGNFRTPALIAPIAGRQQLSFTAGAAADRLLRQRKPDEARRMVFGTAPISDTAVLGPIENPTRPFTSPAAMTLLRYFGLVK